MNLHNNHTRRDTSHSNSLESSLVNPARAEPLSLSYAQLVKVPDRFSKSLWDDPNKNAPLDKLILRIMTYSKFEDIRWLYEKYRDGPLVLSKKFADVKQGVKFWLEYWHG